MKKKIHIFGKHGLRTPFAYSAYKTLFLRHFEYTDSPELADYLVTGFSVDFRENYSSIKKYQRLNPNLKLVVFSEEPLWDTAHTTHFDHSKGSYSPLGDNNQGAIEFQQINHVTSKIFDFNSLPYFITTNDDYYLRYSRLFKRNSELSSKYLKINWETAQVKYAFFAARRVAEKYNCEFSNGSILGLNAYRSHLAEKIQDESVIREGHGWTDSEKRQTLPDWHLDKLATLDQKSVYVSALENTHMRSYVSEKIFDAFAVLGIPIYYAQTGHQSLNLFEKDSFINLASLTIDKAIKKLDNFEISDDFITNYQSTQLKLASLFENPTSYLNERKRLVNETVKEFSLI